MSDKKYNLIAVIGPTACGKTRFAANLAYSLDSEVISADSRQVYKHMNLGTGKDYDDYIVNGKEVTYHLIDIVDAGYKYNLYMYQKDFTKVFNNVSSKGKMPVLCGGTGMYVEAALRGYQMTSVPVNEELRNRMEEKSLEELAYILSRCKKLHNTTDTDTKKRAVRALEIEYHYRKWGNTDMSFPEIKPLIIGLKIDRELRRKKITERLKARIESGMIEEVKNLLDIGVSSEDLIYYGLEYKYITLHVIGRLSYNEMFNQLNTAIHQFAKRQMTWFRGMERRGLAIHWLDSEMDNEIKVKKTIELLEY